MGKQCGSRFRLSLAAFCAMGAIIFAGCEPDDPEVRKELVELRTEVATARQELESLRSELAVVSRKAQKVEFLEVAQLESGLERMREPMRKAVGDAFPGYELVSVGTGSVETPITTETPYMVRVNFFLREGSSGEEFGPYSLVLRADRTGAWQLPSPEVIQAGLGGSAGSAGSAGSGGSDRSGRSGGSDGSDGSDGSGGDTRVIQWDAGGSAPARPPEAAERGRPALPQRGPEGGIPTADPIPGAQETRSVEW